MQTLIKGYTFSLTEPFHPGTVITKGEAQALNKLRVENIANNLRELVNKAVATLEPGEMLSQEKLAEIQAEITRYDLGYQFLERHSPRTRLGAIEQEARAVARERIEAQARRDGAELTEEQIEQLVGETEGLPAVQEEARLRVSARRRVTSEGLDSL